jgi:hypothetical protein
MAPARIPPVLAHAFNNFHRTCPRLKIQTISILSDAKLSICPPHPRVWVRPLVRFCIQLPLCVCVCVRQVELAATLSISGKLLVDEVLIVNCLPVMAQSNAVIRTGRTVSRSANCTWDSLLLLQEYKHSAVAVELHLTSRFLAKKHSRECCTWVSLSAVKSGGFPSVRNNINMG